MSSIPFDTLTGKFLSKERSDTFKILGVLKLVRISKINRFIRGLNIERELKSQISLMYLIFVLFLYLHCMSCIWYFLSMRDMKWIPGYDTIFDGDSQRVFWNLGLLDQYLISLYMNL